MCGPDSMPDRLIQSRKQRVHSVYSKLLHLCSLHWIVYPVFPHIHVQHDSKHLHLHNFTVQDYFNNSKHMRELRCKLYNLCR